MIPTPEDRQLAATFVATFADPSTTVVLAEPGSHPVHPDEEWEFAYLLVAVARRAGWTPPNTKPVTPEATQV
jgi:hypothetical protein